MKKKFLVFLVSVNSIAALNPVSAQVTGDSIVCSGYIYNYSVIIPGAVTYNWTTPAGWYGLTGQNTAFITVTCNVNDGPVCVEGFDGGANSLGTFCIPTSFGYGGAQGWDLLPNPISGCLDPPFNFIPTIQPNGTGGGLCPAGCGNGIMHPNLNYCLYSGPWPTGLFISIIDGVTPVSSIGIPAGTLYAYFVDITNGFQSPAAVQITGGCGSAVVNNASLFTYIDPVWPMLGAAGGNCVGDTVIISDGSGAAFNYWDFEWGGHLITGPNDYPAYFVVDSTYCELYFDGTDINGCHTYGVWQGNFVYCVPPVAGFAAADSFLCPGTCTDFFDQTINGVFLQWLFPGGNPSSSTDNNPQNICYNSPGTYDVTLIVANGTGSDTLTLINYITVFPFPPAISIVQHGDTLIANSGLSTYQWFYNGSLITGATDFYHIATADGDYNVVCQDANGCEVEAVINNVLTEIIIAALENAIEIFPNPADGELKFKNTTAIVFGVTMGKAVTVTIFDIVGVKIKTVELNAADMIISTADLPDGYYTGQLSFDCVIRNFSFMVHHSK